MTDTPQLSDAELRRLAKLVGQTDDKPWAESRGSEGWLAALVPAGAAVLAVVPKLVGGRPLEPIEFTALVVAAGFVASAYVLGRSMIKAEAIRAGKE